MAQAIDGFIEGAAIKAANHFTRRSFIGRVAGTTGAMATAGLAVGAPEAAAVCPGQSVTCNVLYGYNHCSENTCYDGSWVVPPGHCDHVQQCGSHRVRWRDCCAPPSCTAHHVAGEWSCRWDCIYNGGGCNGYPRVRCRFWACGS